MNPAPDYVYIDFVRQDILRMIPEDGAVIGSFGCGRAATEAELVKRGRQVHGADISEVALSTAKDRLTSVRVVGPDDGCPFEQLSLDGLILADILEHLPKAWERLQEMASAVRPGGWVVISVPNMQCVEVLLQLGLRGDWPENPMGIFDASHLQVMTYKRLLRWANAAGLTLDRWFDAYDYRSVQRNVYRLLNLCTARLLRGWFNFEVQGRFRKPA